MVDAPDNMPGDTHVEMLLASRSGSIGAIAADEIGAASVRLGAGREKKGQPIDHRTGIVVHAKVGTRVERGSAFAEVHHAGRPGDEAAIEQVRAAFRWSARPVTPHRLVLGRVGT